MSNDSNSNSLPLSTMEEDVDNDKTDRKSSALITRPVRSRTQRKFDDFFVYGLLGPPSSSTPIKRSNSQNTHPTIVESPESISDFFSPSTELNLTSDQSSTLDESNSTSNNISRNQSSHQTWTLNSLSHLNYLGKRDISRLDTDVDSPTPLKKKRGRPPKINYAANDNSSKAVTKEVFHTPVGEIKEKALENRFEEKDQEVDNTHSCVNETSSSFQEEDNPHRFDLEKRQDSSTNSGPMSDNSQVIALMKDKSATPEEKRRDRVKEVSSVEVPMKKGRGRPRKHPRLIGNNQMNDRLSCSLESQVKEGVYSSSKDESHGCGKDITAEVSTSEERVKSQGGLSQGDSAQEQDSLIDSNSFSGLSVKRHRGRPKRYSPTQSNDMQMKDFSPGSFGTPQAEVKSQDMSRGNPVQELDSLIHRNSFSSSSVKRSRGRPKKYSRTQSNMSHNDPAQEQGSLLQRKGFSGSSLKRGRGRPKKYSRTQSNDIQMKDCSFGSPVQELNSCIETKSFSASSMKRSRGRPKKYSLTQSKGLQMQDFSLESSGTSQADVKSQDLSQGHPAQELDSYIETYSFSGSSMKRSRGRPKKYSRTQPKGIQMKDFSLESSGTSQADVKSPDMSQGHPAQELDNCIETNSFSGSSMKSRGRPKKYSRTQSSGIQIKDCSLDSFSISQAEDSFQCPSDALGNDEVGISRKNSDGGVQESSICSEREKSYEDAYQSSYVKEQERDVDSNIMHSNPASSPYVKRRPGRPSKFRGIKRGRGNPRKPEVTCRGHNRVDGAYFGKESNVVRKEDQLNENDLQRKSSQSKASNSSLDENEDQKVTSSHGRGKGGQVKSSRSMTPSVKSSAAMTPSNDVKCSHCELPFKSLKAYKNHLMTKHSLVYTTENPQGVYDPYLIKRQLGYVDCQKCKRRFKNAQYYGHHIVWCGRENEMFVCSICGRETKVMWEKQHMRMHKQQQESKLQAVKMKEEELERREQIGKEKQEEQPAGKQIRQAARSALSMLNNLEQMSDGSTVSSDENDITSDDDDDDDDNDDEDDDNDDEKVEEDEEQILDEEQKEKLYAKEKSRKITAKHRMWISACKQIGGMSTSQKLNHLCNYYDGAGQNRLFQELSPMSENWQVLSSSERDKYLPHLKQSPVISSVQGESRGAGTFTLTLGESKCIQEKAFCYAGGPIWAMEWCPRPVACYQEQMLAIALDNEPGHHLYVNKVVECSNLLQFWSVRKEIKSKEISPRLDFCIAHDSGYIRSLCWCPLGCFDQIDSKEKDCSFSQEKVPSTLPRLGLLAAACSNATILIFSIPHPSSLDSSIQSTSDHHQPIIVKPKPCLKLAPNSRSDATPCLSVSWQNSDGCDRIIGGYGRGEVLMWSLACSSTMAQEDIKTLRPIRAFVRHKIGVVTCVWCPTSPHLFVSCDFQGFIYLWNSNRPQEPESVLKKSNFLATKAISMAGPLHWGFFAVNDKMCIPDNPFRTTDMYVVNFHGITPKCSLSSDFNLAILLRTVCTWDVTFDPVFNILVICDAVGNVHLALPTQESLLKSSIQKIHHFISQILQTRLYKLSVTSEHKDAKENTSLAITDGQKEETVQQSDPVESDFTRTNCCTEISEESSVPLNEKEAWSKDNTDENTGTGSLPVTSEMDPKSPSQIEKAPDDVMLCFHEYAMDNDLKKISKKSKKTKKTTKKDVCSADRESVGGSNNARMESIQRVRLCPGTDSNLWLASGGNAGILRFDRLHDLVVPFSKRMGQAVLQLKREESTKNADS